MGTTLTPRPLAHKAEQKQKQRTFVVLPKPDKLIRYRQGMGRGLLVRTRSVTRVRPPSATLPNNPHRCGFIPVSLAPPVLCDGLDLGALARETPASRLDPQQFRPSPRIVAICLPVCLPVRILRSDDIHLSI